MKKKTKIFLLEFIILVVVGSFYSRLLFVSFIWAILHEVAHIAVAKFFDVKLGNMKINITGVSTYGYELEELNDNKKIIVFLAGPLFNLILVLVFLGLYEFFKIPLIKGSIDINISLAVFNMLPAYPLDGARICENFLAKRFLYKKVKDVLITISFALAVILVSLFCITIYIHKVNFSILLAAILITYSTILEKKTRMYIAIGNIFRKRRKIIKEDYIENKAISIYYKISLVRVLRLIDRDRFNSFYVLDDEMKLLGVIHEDAVIDGLKQYGNITVRELMIKNNLK